MSLRMLSLHRSISGPHLYPLWHKAKRKQTVCPAQHPGFLFAEVMEIRDSGLAHLKQLQGTGLSVFLGPCVSDHSTAQDVKDAGVLGAFRALLCASWNRNKIFFWSKTLHGGTCWIQRTCKNLIQPVSFVKVHTIFYHHLRLWKEFSMRIKPTEHNTSK